MYKKIESGAKCALINAEALKYGYQLLQNTKTLQRFQDWGVQMVINENDNESSNYGTWTLAKVDYKEEEINVSSTTITDDNKKILKITSPSLSFSINDLIPITRGLHFCKLLSPAYVVEWMYIGGLKEYYSLKNKETKTTTTTTITTTTTTTTTTTIREENQEENKLFSKDDQYMKKRIK